MSDNFGSDQNRVLEVKGRNIDNVVFLHRRPPLSSEWNLISQIASEKEQKAYKISSPSGFLEVGDIIHDFGGDFISPGVVETSESFPENSFRLTSGGKNWAIVNGWPILVEGVGSQDKHNTIKVGDPGSQRYDFVFLEVYRKLVTSGDPLYPLGNTHTTPYTDNEIMWAAAGVETSSRVQVQYRVRVQEIFTQLPADTEVFDDVSIKPIGGRDSEDVYSSFRRYGPEDPGLWVAGDGSRESKENLNTVDGFVYAIPMFIVNRRELSEEPFDRINRNRTSVRKADKVLGQVSDRPDNLLADVIYASDIIDVRHIVSPSGIDIDSVVDKTIDKLINGTLSTSVSKPFGNDGKRTTVYSGGSELLKIEQLNSVVSSEFPSIGNGSSVAPDSYKRRSFANAPVNNTYQIIEIHPGTDTDTWEPGPLTVDISGFPDGVIDLVRYMFSDTLENISGVTYRASQDSIDIVIDPASNIVGTSHRAFLVFDYLISPSNIGFKDTPSEILEVHKESAGRIAQIAPYSTPVPIRYDNTGNLIETTDSGHSNRDYVANKGVGSLAAPYDFGHEMTVYRKATNGRVVLHTDNGTISGHYILGIKSVLREELDGTQTRIPFNVERSINADGYVDSYLVSVADYNIDELQLKLYTGSKPQGSYASDIQPNDSCKYFVFADNASRGIEETLETIEAYAKEVSAGVYELDTDQRVIYRIAHMVVDRGVGSEVDTVPFVYDPDGNLLTNITLMGTSAVNSILPISVGSNGFNPCKIRISTDPGHGNIMVPLITYSFVQESEDPYDIYYKCIPYQGVLARDSYKVGEVIKRCDAFVTNEGPRHGSTGSIMNLPAKQFVDYTFSANKIDFIYHESSNIRIRPKTVSTDIFGVNRGSIRLGGPLTQGSGRGLQGVYIDVGGKTIGLDIKYGKTMQGVSGETPCRVAQFYVVRSTQKEQLSGINIDTGRLYLLVVVGDIVDNELSIINDCVADLFEIQGRPLIK